MNLKNQEGISLIVLCITIVVMMIIAGASLHMLFDADGLFRTSQETQDMKKNYANQQEQTTNEFMNQIDGNNEKEYKDSSGANPPKLGDGMIPVKWDETNWVVTDSNDSEWYSYTDKRWANIMLTDGLQVEGVPDSSTASIDTMKGKRVTSVGSMFVWIPRYSYQIDSNWHTNSTTGGVVNIKFLKGLTDTATLDGTKSWDNTSGEKNWNIHPAFEYGEPVSGIWVAKFEASHADSTSSSAGSSNTIKIQAGVQSWRSITINDIYSKCLSYNSALNSHQMKNSEWGACAYLAQSVYGKNSEVWINPNSNYITGQAGTGVSVSGTTSTNAYNTTNGMNASTTGNIYGIYDMSGGAWEYTAAYVNNGHANLNTYGASLVGGNAKTKDVYTSATSSGANTQSQDYETARGKYGDAVYETSSSYSSSNGSWYGDYAYFPSGDWPFFHRGGGYNSASGAGLFYFNYRNGNAGSNYGFRPVLCVM